MATHDLLKPSLGRGRDLRAPYSHQAAFLVSFFGGAPAAVLMGGVNAWRAARLPADLAWLLALLAGYVALEWARLRTVPGQQVYAGLQALLGDSASSVLHRGLGLLCFGAVSLAHAREQRTATLVGAQRPPGTWVGMGLIVLGVLASYGITQALA